MTTRRTHRGFTLVEAIIAIVVLSIAMPAMLWTLRESTAERVDPVMLTRARWLAAERLEMLTADRHSATRGYAFIAAGNYLDEASISGFPGFTREVDITVVGPRLQAGGTGYKLATVRVAWTDTRQQPRTLELSTVFAEYP
jgi:prepilin-type N-terminal cleavage/methylation domain-containing protein